ncbi:MAG TPA: Gfo/Idh/MocA family oxidoreductase [Acetobacteraceae bacterium]|jgi:predicted dehydrogenase|nr:Gfo/Idh/MocA family oxidoreductase [Acetobacteraceae bacterium]HTC11676.1 Gfo/Idh/MocA family oxidoreductase [Acetobacteraceae bacterium]
MPTRLVLIGAGAIGRTHLRAASETSEVTIVGVADPNPAAQALAAEFGATWQPDYRTLLDSARPDGAIVATPNALHVPIALDCIARGVAVQVEKPIADTLDQARRLSEAAASARIPVLVGHHRRHNPIIRRARELVRGGALGRLVSGSVLSLFLKSPSYFDIPWRRMPDGGGPVLINMIHEIDLIRYVCGEIVRVQAVTSNAVRGFAVEDTAAVILTLENGALVTVTLSDTAASPWSWDLSAGESLSLFNAGADSHFLAGTEGALTLPSLTHWRYPSLKGWEHELAHETIPITRANPYANQLRHFAAVIRGKEQPITSGPDGARTLAATLAVQRAAQSGTSEDLA